MKPPPTPVVNAVADVMTLKGSAHSHVLLCDDGIERLVKFHDGGKVVVNEFLGQKVCQLVGLPVHADAFVVVSRELIETSPALKSQGVLAGIHYGKVYDRRASDLQTLTVSDSGQVLNASSLPGVILLDNLVYNTDTGDQNHLLTPATSGGYTYSVIDLGNSAGGNWTPKSLQTTSTQDGLVKTHALLMGTVTGVESFSPFLENIEALSRGDLIEVVESIPPTWGVTPEEGTAWVEFILRRSQALRNTILVNATAFPAWRKPT